MQPRPVWEFAIREAEQSPTRDWIGLMYSRVKRAASARGIDFEMNVALGDWGEDIFRLLAEGYCCKTGKLKGAAARNKVTDEVIAICSGGSRSRP